MVARETEEHQNGREEETHPKLDERRAGEGPRSGPQA